MARCRLPSAALEAIERTRYFYPRFTPPRGTSWPKSEAAGRAEEAVRTALPFFHCLLAPPESTAKAAKATGRTPTRRLYASRPRWVPKLSRPLAVARPPEGTAESPALPPPAVEVTEDLRQHIQEATGGKPFPERNIPLADYSRMSPPERTAFLAEVFERNQDWLNAVLGATDAAWLQIVDGEVTALSDSTLDMPDDEELHAQAIDRGGLLPYVFTRSAGAIIEENVTSWSGKFEDYPQVSVTVAPDPQSAKRREYMADFDTGAEITHVGFEILLKDGVLAEEPKVGLRDNKHQLGSFLYYRKRLHLKLGSCIPAAPNGPVTRSGAGSRAFHRKTGMRASFRSSWAAITWILSS